MIIPTKYGYSNFNTMVTDYPLLLNDYKDIILYIIAEKFMWFYNNYYAKLLGL